MLHMTAQNDTGTLGGPGSGQTLNAVVVGSKGTSAVLTLRVKDANGGVISIIDASVTGSYQFGGAVFDNGVYAALTGGSADVTVC